MEESIKFIDELLDVARQQLNEALESKNEEKVVEWLRKRDSMEFIKFCCILHEKGYSAEEALKEF